MKSIPGFGDAVAHAWLAEIGPPPHEYFGSHEKLASWVTLCPGNHMSAGQRTHGHTGKAGTYIKPMLAQAAWSAIRTEGRAPAAARTVRGAVHATARRQLGLTLGHIDIEVADIHLT